MANIDGGDGGLSLIRNNAGRHIPIVMRVWIDMNKLNLPLVSSIEGPYSSLSLFSKIMMIKIELIKIPNGVETKAIEVARLRSLSPNQFDASLETGFLRNAKEQAQMMWPKYQAYIEVKS